jgi:nitrate reductase NapE component
MLPFDCRQKWRMARRLSNIEVAAIVIIVLSVAFLAFVGFSIWMEP